MSANKNKLIQREVRGLHLAPALTTVVVHQHTYLHHPIQICQEEHKKTYPDASVSFSEFSKRLSKTWKTIFTKVKGKYEVKAMTGKAHYERGGYVFTTGDRSNSDLSKHI